jgi:hypothetical protein
MVTHEQLIKLNLTTKDETLYFDTPDWDIEYNRKTQELWFINDGYGEPDLIGRFTRIEELKEAIDLLKQ